MSHWLPSWFVAAYNWGVAGVHLFFAISGYVITRILLVELDRDIHEALTALQRYDYTPAADIYQGVLGRWAEIRSREILN